MILVIDNYDSFTFTLVDYLTALGATVEVERSDSISVNDALASGASGILISPGPGRPEQAGISVDLAAACIQRRVPLLGVCLGHQALAIACGNQVDRVPPMHGKVASVNHDGSGLFGGLPSPFAATRYHSLAVGEPCSPLVANAWAGGLVMAMRHETAPAHGVQFHPESVASEHGHALLRAFMQLTVDEPRNVS